MASHTYSARELLHVRNLPSRAELYGELRRRLREKSDLVDVIRPAQNRKLTRIPEETRDTSTESNESIHLKRASAPQLDGTDSEWKYRGRTDSEDVEPQPISAPTGLAAQKDEGFQRFYRAVISPSHVRVTAGGRIVPNTRGPPSPTNKWPKDTISNGDGAPRQPSIGACPENFTVPLPQGAYRPYPTVYPGFAPPMAAAPAPYTLVPWYMGMNMGTFPMPPRYAPQYPMMQNPSTSSKKDKKSDSDNSEKVSAARPPLEHDHSRSIPYHGQWMPPQGGHYYPYGMMPPAYPPHPYPAPMMAAPPPFAMNASPRSAPGNTGGESSVHPATSVPAMPGAPAQPPVSSIRPSDITKRHIDILRARLRFLEDQMQYNKHQIDERAVEADAQLARQYIQQFEKNLEVQLSFEESNYPRQDDRARSGNSAASNGASYPRSSTSSTTYQDDAGIDRPRGKHPARDTSGPRRDLGINSTKSVSAYGSMRLPAKTSAVPERHSRKSSLPVGAALAAPFQPRAKLFSSPTRGTVSSLFSGPIADELHHASRGDDVEENARPVPTYSSSGGNADRDVPYLVGQVPSGVPRELLREADYTYDRDLTEDELRARHMYWGKAPRDLQRGLPKFNGKDFFPPSPVKGSSSDTPSSPGLDNNRKAKDSNLLMRKGTVDSDPFQSLGQTGKVPTRDVPGNSTQSESLPGPETPPAGSSFAPQRVAAYRANRIGQSLDDFQHPASNCIQLSQSTSKDRSSSDEAEEDRELIFTGRRTMSRAKTRNDIWSTMLRKGKSSANAVPGTVSSMTAQGVLPHYAGHATASLTPTIANKVSSPRAHVSKILDIAETRAGTDKRGENRPPTDFATGDAGRGANF